MKALNQALYRFWSQFTHNGAPIKAYLMGQVPSKATFPYITFEVAAGEAFASTVLTAFVWCRSENGQSVNAQRAELLDAIAAQIPQSGRRIPFEGGFAVISRNPADFQTYYDDEEDETVFGGRTSYEIRFYTL